MSTGSERVTTGAEANAESFQGPLMVTRRSTIRQMIDPSGKAVSQYVVIIDSIFESLNDNLSGYKELHNDLGELVLR
jgi:hypothetical protein